MCARVCVTMTSPFLNLTSCITSGSVLVSPGDSQSVLALQYKGIVIFKERPLPLGPVLCEPVCGTAQLEYVCVSEPVCMLTQYIFIQREMYDWKIIHIRQCRALITCQTVKNMGAVVVMQ